MRQIELLKLGENVLKKENIQDSHIKASTLLQYVLKQTKQELIINSKEIVEPSKINKYNNYLQKIIKGTPIQYITKHQQFMALDFYVDENVLIPQPDTEVLVEEGIKIIKEQNMEVLDLCTGSGAIAISIAHYCQNSTVTATDISQEALEVARKNVNLNNVNIEFIESNLFAAKRLKHAAQYSYTFSASTKTKRVYFNTNILTPLGAPLKYVRRRKNTHAGKIFLLCISCRRAILCLRAAFRLLNQ